MILFFYRNSSSIAFFSLFLESLYCCIFAILNAGTFSFSFIFWHINYVYAIFRMKSVVHIILNFLVLWSICLSSFQVNQFKNDPAYLTRETTYVFIPLMRFLLQKLVSRSFFSSYKLLFPCVFSHLFLFGACLHYFQAFVIFFFIKCTDFFFIIVYN